MRLQVNKREDMARAGAYLLRKFKGSMYSFKYLPKFYEIYLLSTILSGTMNSYRVVRAISHTEKNFKILQKV